MALSPAEQMALLPRAEWERWLNQQPNQILEEIARGEWWWVARPEQIPPQGAWAICLILAGRGFGKSRLASEWLVQQVLDHPVDRNGFRTEWLMIAETLSDARTICIEGPSGVLRVLDRRQIPYKYIRHPKPKVEIGEVKSTIFFEGADSPDVGRGYNAAGAVLDEVAKWKKPRESWYEGIMPSLRADLVGDHPRTLVTTTPKPIDLLREWVKRDDGTVRLVRGSTYDNRANLSRYTLEEMERRYAGTTLGRQELEGELIDGRDGCLWSWSMIDSNRVTHDQLNDIELAHITVGVDPTQTEEGDEMGVVVVARDGNNHMYVIADESLPLAGKNAADHIWRVFHRYAADTVVYEDNAGKKWMKDVLTDSFDDLRDKDLLFPKGTNAPLKGIDSRMGKSLRAEPVALRYEQDTVHHVGEFRDLEEQMLKFDPTASRKSPDRMDALVHACRHLMKGEKRILRVAAPSNLWIPIR